MEDIAHISMLLDFYGKLLTDRQREMIDLFCNFDYSLGEIARQFNISRQGVHDSIRTAKQQLMEYEDKLNLIENHLIKNQLCDEMTVCLNCFKKNRSIFDIDKSLDDFIIKVDNIKNIGEE
jgi:uncharacterized protein